MWVYNLIMLSVTNSFVFIYRSPILPLEDILNLGLGEIIYFDFIN